MARFAYHQAKVVHSMQSAQLRILVAHGNRRRLIVLTSVVATLCSQGADAFAQPAPSPAPMSGFNAQRTSQSTELGPQVAVRAWKTPLGGESFAPPALAEDGTIYALGGSDLIAVAPSGSILWRFSSGNEARGAPAVAADGTIYFGSSDEGLYAINPDGSLKWRFDAGGDVDRPVLIGEDGSIYSSSRVGFQRISPEGNSIYDVDFPISSRTVFHAALLPDGDAVVITSGSFGQISRIAADGSRTWVVDRPNYNGVAIEPDGVIVTGRRSGDLVTLDPATGLELSSTPIPSIGPIAVSSDSLGNAYASTDARVAKFAPDRTRMWTSSVEVFRAGSPAIDAAGVVYTSAGLRFNRLYALDPLDGTELWRFSAGSGFEAFSSPVLGENGVIYATSFTQGPGQDGFLYAVVPEPDSWSLILSAAFASALAVHRSRRPVGRHCIH